MEHALAEHAHPTPKLYAIILTTLITLTLITVVVAYQDFGALNNIVALGIAGLKTTLVVLFFMHVKYGSRTTKIFAAAGFFWLSILIFFTIADTESRRPPDRPRGWTQLPAERAVSRPVHAGEQTEHDVGIGQEKQQPATGPQAGHAEQPAAAGEHH